MFPIGYPIFSCMFPIGSFQLVFPGNVKLLLFCSYFLCSVNRASQMQEFCGVSVAVNMPNYLQPRFQGIQTSKR